LVYFIEVTSFHFFFGNQKFSKFPVFNIRIPCRNKREDLLYECLPWRSHPQPLLQQEQWLTYYRVCLCYWELQFFEMQIYKDRVRAFCGYAFKFFLSLCKCMLLTYWFVFVHRYIRRAKPDAGFPLFQSESLKWPGFVEFDDVNAKVLTYSAQDRYFPSLFLFLFHFYCVRFPPVILSYPLLSNDNSIYKVFDLKNYTMLYSISDRNVQEIKIRYFSSFRLIFCFTVLVSAKTPFW
jgi:hypothetical protein